MTFVKRNLHQSAQGWHLFLEQTTNPIRISDLCYQPNPPRLTTRLTISFTTPLAFWKCLLKKGDPRLTTRLTISFTTPLAFWKCLLKKGDPRLTTRLTISLLLAGFLKMSSEKGALVWDQWRTDDLGSNVEGSRQKLEMVGQNFWTIKSVPLRSKVGMISLGFNQFRIVSEWSNMNWCWHQVLACICYAAMLCLRDSCSVGW